MLKKFINSGDMKKEKHNTSVYKSIVSTKFYESMITYWVKESYQENRNYNILNKNPTKTTSEVVLFLCYCEQSRNKHEFGSMTEDRYNVLGVFVQEHYN